MLSGRLPFVTALLCLLIIEDSSCLVRRRLITRTGTGSGKQSPTLLIANEQTLIDNIAKQYRAVRDLNATVDMVPALGSAEKNHITEYKDVTGYILVKTPADIRLIGLVPVLRNKAFDMVSTGPDFKLYIPSRNLFITGQNEIIKPAVNKLENLRPRHFLDAMMVQPVDLKNNKVLMENLTDEDEAYYILHEIHEGPDGALRLKRTIWFNRLDLLLARQLIFDGDGNILTDARYSQWKSYDNVPFPKHIDINRPHDEYGVVLDVVKMDINKGVLDDKFVLDQPEGTKLQVLGQPKAATDPKEAPAPKVSK